jgi:hypothetical protein
MASHGGGLGLRWTYVVGHGGCTMVRAVDLHSAETKVWVFYFHFLSWLQWVVIGFLWVVISFGWVAVPRFDGFAVVWVKIWVWML